jgi:hypothetical protein
MLTLNLPFLFQPSLATLTFDVSHAHVQKFIYFLLKKNLQAENIIENQFNITNKNGKIKEKQNKGRPHS